jgi:hypothetical protein
VFFFFLSETLSLSPPHLPSSTHTNPPHTQLKVLLALEDAFDLRFEDEAAAAAARCPADAAALLAAGVAAADARAAAGPLAGAGDVEALAAASSFFQFSSELAEARGEDLGPIVRSGRGWDEPEEEEEE